jgi:hypothetical protein
LLSDPVPGLAVDLASQGATLQADVQGLLDYSQTLIEGEELMFIMDVPAVPPQQTPIVLAQAGTPGVTPQFDYILKDCQDTQSTGDSRSAIRAVDPAYMLKNYLQNRDGQYVELKAIKTTLLEGTKHGEITKEVDNTGLTFYGYDAEPEYVGNDRAVFTAEFEGKRYKIVIDLKVFLSVDENVPSACPPPKLIKVTKPSSGASDYGDGYNLSPASVTFADLPNRAVGQTTGSTITLDTNAAGYNWFIDTTPADNSEYLPTSNPNEWVAKEGTDAYGKMDMLSKSKSMGSDSIDN